MKRDGLRPRWGEFLDRGRAGKTYRVRFGLGEDQRAGDCDHYVIARSGGIGPERVQGESRERKITQNSGTKVLTLASG